MSNLNCQHRAYANLSLQEAEDRLSKGEQQAPCVVCGKWMWRRDYFTVTDFLEAMDYGDAIAGATAYEERRRRRTEGGDV
jgi:hypothetical protein